MALRDVVDVQISRQTATITRAGFGTLAFVFDAVTAPSARVLAFGSADEVDSSTELTANAKAALTAAFSGDLAPTLVKAIYRLTGQVNPDNDETYSQALTAAQNLDEQWYAFGIESRAEDDILAVAAWAEARTKIFVAASPDADILLANETTDVASRLLAGSFSRTALIYSAEANTKFPDMAWAGGVLPNDPGTVTWAFKRVPGVEGQTFTAAQITALDNKRVSRVENIQSLSRAIGGYTSDPGAFLDIIRGMDWLSQSMAEDVFITLAQSGKIPYTNAGIAIIETAVRARLQIAINRDVLADDEYLTVTTPDISATSSGDRANRILRDVNFTGRLAGAIHRVIIRGVVTV